MIVFESGGRPPDELEGIKKEFSFQLCTADRLRPSQRKCRDNSKQ
jgi:hypothetical protein